MGRRHEHFHAHELPGDERAAIIDAYRRHACRPVDRLFRSMPDPATHPVFVLDPVASTTTKGAHRRESRARPAPAKTPPQPARSALAWRSWLAPVARAVFGGVDPPKRRQSIRRDLKELGGDRKVGAGDLRHRGQPPPVGRRVVNASTEPVGLHCGLALYQRGEGGPLLVLPYPHASGGGPMIDGPLASLAVGCGFQVSTFDPPGQYRSTRPARVSLEEMVDCATETLDTLALPARVAVIGHSMSALCAFYVGLAHPERVARLVLVGTPPGSGLSIVRYRAMPFHWPPWNPNLWRMAVWGIRLASGHGSLETHKKLDLLSDRSNFVNQALVSPIVIEPGDRHLPAPPADRWWRAIRTARLIPRASELRCPTLLIVGRHDPQTPVRVSRALHKRIPDSRLEIFERSGHSPFQEEPERFAQVLNAFLVDT